MTKLTHTLRDRVAEAERAKHPGKGT